MLHFDAPSDCQAGQMSKLPQVSAHVDLLRMLTPEPVNQRGNSC
jgi:hypothetical protein